MFLLPISRPSVEYNSSPTCPTWVTTGQPVRTQPEVIRDAHLWPDTAGHKVKWCISLTGKLGYFLELFVKYSNIIRITDFNEYEYYLYFIFQWIQIPNIICFRFSTYTITNIICGMNYSNHSNNTNYLLLPDPGRKSLPPCRIYSVDGNGWVQQQRARSHGNTPAPVSGSVCSLGNNVQGLQC